MSNMKGAKGVGILMVPYPAHSHLNMSFHLSHLLLISSSNNVSLHFASSTQHINQVKVRNPELSTWYPPQSDHAAITFHEFFLPSCNDLVDIHRTLPHLHQPVSALIRDLSSKYSRIVVIYDLLMASVVAVVKAVPNAEAYSFRTISAFTVFVNVWKAMPVKPFELDASNALPSFLPSAEDAHHPPEFAAFVTQQWTLNHSIETGILYNTSRLIDGAYIGLLEKLMPAKKHFAVGPVNNKDLVLSRLSETSATKLSADSQTFGKLHPHKKHVCLEWLDCQEKDSVIYVSFGTTISIPEKHVHELATGLEKSGQKFIWVLRNADKGDIFAKSDHEQEDEVRKLLPEGFIERVGNKGMVVTSAWVPQVEILGHPSVGGFLTHCCWGSLSESMSMGVPVIACPVHSDQPLNSVLVTQVLRTGFLIRDDFWEKRGEATSPDIVASSVKRLMATDEGEEMRRRAKDLGQALEESTAQGGLCQLEMDDFLAHITRP